MYANTLNKKKSQRSLARFLTGNFTPSSQKWKKTIQKLFSGLIPKIRKELLLEFHIPSQVAIVLAFNMNFFLEKKKEKKLHICTCE